MLVWYEIDLNRFIGESTALILKVWGKLCWYWIETGSGVLLIYLPKNENNQNRSRRVGGKCIIDSTFKNNIVMFFFSYRGREREMLFLFFLLRCALHLWHRVMNDHSRYKMCAFWGYILPPRVRDPAWPACCCCLPLTSILVACVSCMGHAAPTALLRQEFWRARSLSFSFLGYFYVFWLKGYLYMKSQLDSRE